MVVSATGLSFQTFAPTAGDILTSSSGSIADGVTVFAGTLAANADFAATSAFSQYSEFTAGFSQLGMGTFAAGNVSVSIPTGSISAGLNLWLLVDNTIEQGAFFLGTTTGLGGLVSTPALSTPGLGSSSGNNVLLAVPEPSSFAFLAGCLGLAGVMLRRRR